MSNIASFLIAPAARVLGYAEKLVTDIDPADFGIKPSIGGKPVDANTPAFVYGHLCLYPSRMAELLGLDTQPLRLPDGWDELFKAGAPCKDDPDCAIYPPKDKLVSTFLDVSRRAVDIVKLASDDALEAVTPIERYREAFPRVGDAIAFLIGPHNMMHLGQVSYWRRCMGLPSAM